MHGLACGPFFIQFLGAEGLILGSFPPKREITSKSSRSKHSSAQFQCPRGPQHRVLGELQNLARSPDAPSRSPHFGTFSRKHPPLSGTSRVEPSPRRFVFPPAITSALWESGMWGRTRTNHTRLAARLLSEPIF